ncbi:MAG TPA: glycosyltransferase [Blastocatellia bacterium]|nr:glycosyltransferase [Blastocatellia bacterium]
MGIESTNKTAPAVAVDTGVCTIISKNYLPYARVLADSFAQYHSDIPFFVLLVDRVDGYFKPDEESFRLVQIEDLDIPDLNRFCFQYTILELNTAVKPYLIGHLLEKYGLRKIVYFDPDILIFNDLSGLFDLLNRNSIVLTPHLTAPIEQDGLKPTENDILVAGAYNLGFIALADSQTTVRFLQWWQERLYDKCVVSFQKGLFVDQKWIDLIPGFFDDVYILRDPGYNVAYWNLNSRTVEMRGDKPYINGSPCYFFHFSGFNPENIKSISKHQNRFTIKNVGQARALFEMYRDRLLKHGYKDTKNWPYAFGYFDNGVKILDAMRGIYLDMGDEVKRFGNPFNTSSPDSYFNWLIEPVDGEADHDRKITHFWYGVYKHRWDVQQAFPDVFGQHRAAFISWIKNSGISDYSPDPRFIPFNRSDCARNASKSARLYRRLTRPLEPSVKRFLRKTIARNEAVWRKIMTTHRRLKGANVIQPAANAASPNANNYNSATHNAMQNTTSKQQKTFGVNLAGYIASEKGVGEALRSQVRCLEAMKIPYVLNDFRDDSSVNLDRTLTNFSEDNPFSVNLVQVNADQVPGFAWAKGDAYFEGHYNIGYWNWELSDFPHEWLPSFRYFNEVWVASNFALDSVSRVSPIPVVRVPFSLPEQPPIKTLDRSAFQLRKDCFVFLFTFDFHSYLERKNPFGLIEAFKRAFGQKDDVLLVLKCSHSSSDQIETLLDAARGANVKIIDKVISRDEVNALMHLSNCYVSLHRSEGFGLTMAEAMNMGKPVIATSYSGNLDFMNLANSFLVKYRLVEIDKDHGPYKKGYVWAEPDLDHAAELMRFVFNNPEAARVVGRQAQSDIRSLLHPEVVGAIVKDRVLRAASRTGTSRTAISSSSISEFINSSENIPLTTEEGIYRILEEAQRIEALSGAINQVPLKAERGLKRNIEHRAKKFLKWLIHWNTKAQADFNRSVSSSVQMLVRQLQKINRDIAMLRQNESATDEIACSMQRVEGLLEQLARDVDSLRRVDELSERLDQVEADSKSVSSRQAEYLATFRSEVASLINELDNRLSHGLNEMRMRVIRAERAAEGDRAQFGKQAEPANESSNGKQNLPAPSDSIAGKPAAEITDYFMFEHRFRGTVDEIKRRQSAYINFFLDKNNVIDLGCGRGEFLELLAEHGVSATGVDNNQDMVEFCRDRSLPVVQADIFDYLSSLAKESVDGIFAAQVVEHFPPYKISELIRQCHKKLKAGGVIVIETVNTNCSVALSNFFLDPTHVRPVPAELLRFLLEQEMFNIETLKFSSPLPGTSAVQVLDVAGASPEQMAVYQDYAIVATKRQ